MASSGSQVIPRGTYKHQGDWITSIGVSENIVVTGSRDKTLCVWDFNEGEVDTVLTPKSLLTGHNHIIQDVALTPDGQYALSASWDKTLRLWNVATHSSMTQFTGHTHDVLSVALAKGNAQIVSAGRDRVIKLWNIHGECKHTTEAQDEWITCVRFGMQDQTSPIISGGYDKLVKVWDRTVFAKKYELTGHTGYINSISIALDCTLVASGGRDQYVNLSDIAAGKFLFRLNAGDIINSIAFSPNRFWVAVGTDSSLKIFDLSKKEVLVDLKLQAADIEGEAPSADAAEASTKKPPKIPKCLCCAFSPTGTNLFAGYSDNAVRVWNIPGSSS